MSTLKLDKITGRLGVGGDVSPITLSGDTISSFKPPPGGVIEQFMSPCDGSSITVQSGTYTVQNVTARQPLSNSSYEDITGSEISYTPPTGTQTVIYSFNFFFSSVSAHPIGHVRLYIDSYEVTNARSSFGAENWYEGRHTILWPFHIGGSDNNSTGRRSAWTSARTIKMQAKEQNSSHQVELHFGEYIESLSQPVIGITAIAG